MGIFYLLGALLVIVTHLENLSVGIKDIVITAFRTQAVTGGIFGSMTVTAMQALRWGVSRGVFSNEAGLGSAPIAHAASSTESPVKQGLWGMFEVFFTTIVICTFSALIILTTDIWSTGEFQGAALSIASFNAIIPGVGGIVVTLSTIFFALSTILGWAYYGEVCMEFLSHNSKKAVLAYRCIYVIFVFIGTIGSLDLIWSISETMNGLMAIPNLIGIIGLYKVVKTVTKEYF
jgi:AGCS family alanine or glycine:cation symporter